MALKFFCSKCGEEIIVKFLHPGETAKCLKCGAGTIVPDGAAVVSEETTIGLPGEKPAEDKQIEESPGNVIDEGSGEEWLPLAGNAGKLNGHNQTHLVITRNIEDPNVVNTCKNILDEWSGKIPFSPIAKLGSDTEFIAATEYSIYKSRVTTQIEMRRLEYHRGPYRGEQLPKVFQSSVDPESVDLNPFSDFARHHRSMEIFDTRCAHDCSACAATGEVTCPECSGTGQVDCNRCNGYGHNECSECSGTGQITKTRTKQIREECDTCDGKGWWNHPLRGREDCSFCDGRGYNIKDEDEDYDTPCHDCASSGKITCDTCRGRGQVLCDNCDTRRKVTCPTCAGNKKVLAYQTVEVDEEPKSDSSQYIPPTLPKFEKPGHPLSSLKWRSVFVQDEPNSIKEFGFHGHPAEKVVSEMVESCRAKHKGKILRQCIELLACYVVEYQYAYQERKYSIYINMDCGLIGDLNGPIQEFITNIDVLAEKALIEGRFEDAYRLVSRSICMDGITEAEKKLRNQSVSYLGWNYLIYALVFWFLMAICWYVCSVLFPSLEISFLLLIGIPVLFLSAQLVSYDIALRFAGRKERVLVASLIGLLSFFIGAGIGAGDSWIQWIGPVIVGIGLILFLSIRSKSRYLHSSLEEHYGSFESPKALENHVLAFDPKPAIYSKSLIALLFVIALSIIQPLQYLLTMYRPLDSLLDRFEPQYQYVQAESKYRSSLAIWERLLGPEHSIVADSLNNLAVLYAAQGKVTEAKPLYERALAIWGKSLSQNRKDMGVGLCNLALLHYSQGNAAEASALLEKASTLGAVVAVARAQKWGEGKLAELAAHEAAELKSRTAAQVIVEAKEKAEAQFKSDKAEVYAKAEAQAKGKLLADMALIPAGEFMMGSPDKEGGPGERPQHKVYIDAFYIDKYEVTTDKFSAYKKIERYMRSVCNMGITGRGTRPMNCVEWSEASAYCKWAGKRLPTEAEWEKAGRGGTTTKYSFGDQSNTHNDYAWDMANSGGSTQPVGQKKPNQYGLYDMYGNVWEWVFDWYDGNYYQDSPVKNPKGPSSGLSHGIRGGAWGGMDTNYLRSAYRASSNPLGWGGDIGFRCAVSASEINQAVKIAAEKIFYNLQPKGVLTWTKPESYNDSGRRSLSVNSVVTRNDSEIMEFTSGAAHFRWDKHEKYGSWSEKNSDRVGKWYLLPTANPKIFEGQLSDTAGNFIALKLKMN